MNETKRMGRIALAALGAGALLVAWAVMGPRGGAADPPTEPAELARQAVAEDTDARERAIAELREMGPTGLELLLRVHAGDVALLRRGTADTDLPRLGRLRVAIDRVAAQRDAHASSLYWHTDLDAARAEARSSGRPILSLRLLGRLDEELSCANSRMFRTVLYPDPEVSQLLRERFVLHWSSERAAPVIRIDMGDGRSLTRTITGNSVHYVLDARGRPVDAIPGLYSAARFRAELESSLEVAERCDSGDDGRRIACLTRWHLEQLADQQTEWARHARETPLPALASLSLDGSSGPVLPVPSAAAPPEAARVDRLTITKSGMERPMLGAMAVETALLRAIPSDAWWTTAAPAVVGGEPLSPPSRDLMRLKTGRADLGTMTERLERSVAEDTVRNEFVMHRAVHSHFTGRAAPPSFDDINRWVYSELFETPPEDPWLGLAPADLYDGIER